MSVRRTLPAYDVQMQEHLLKQPLPTQSVDQIDPFLLLHHHRVDIEPESEPFREGVGPHPHRGFTPITFIYEGSLQHRDSRGNNSIVNAGGVQWMDVGMGIIHSERPPASFCATGGTQELIQVWVNLPARLKMIEPQYFAIQKDEMPEFANHPDLHISSGTPTLEGPTGPIRSAYPLNAFHGKTTTENLVFEVPEGHQAFLYLLDGGGRIEGYGLAEALTMYELEPGKQTFFPSTPTKVLFLSGEPIQEKKESYGPFVMNNQTQIMEAMRDYQMGKMGFLVEHDMP
ncbi:MAG: hypothetical protein RL754_20 [Bacteroidota bacterium]|jgi:redox-sensitive bicupin YhaK (pirin superfamily)